MISVRWLITEVSSESVRVMGEDWKCIEMRIEGCDYR